MKNLLRALPIALLGALAIVVTLNAQDKKKPETWEEKAAARLKPVAGQLKDNIDAAIPGKATATPKKARRILSFWRCGGFIHTSIPAGNYALEQMAAKTGAYQIDASDDYAVFTKENLAKYDVIVFNNTTNLKFPEESMREAILEFMGAGKGVVGIHAASDNFNNWEAGAEMIGGQFNGHPWNQGGRWAFQLDDPSHPVNKAFNGEGFWHTDEIYQYKPSTFAGAKKLRLLVSLDMSKEENTKILGEKKNKEKSMKDYGTEGARPVPVSWVREYGGGRVFYTNLGHREDTFANNAVLQHILDGVQYAAGDLEADATPTGDNPGAPAPAPAK